MNARQGMAAVAILGLLAASAVADWERTISAWDTKLPDEGNVQLSLWGSYWEWEAGRADGNTLEARLYADYGIADNWSLSIAPGFTRWDVDHGGDEAGIADTYLMTTYRFIDEAASGFDMAVMGSVSLPTGDDDDGLGTGNVEPGVTLLASKDLSPVVAVANAGAFMILDADRGEEDYVLHGSLEGIYPLSEQLSLNAVVSAATARWDKGDDDADVGVGARVTPTEQMFLVGAVYYSLTDNYDWGFQVAAGAEF